MYHASGRVSIKHVGGPRVCQWASSLALISEIFFPSIRNFPPHLWHTVNAAGAECTSGNSGQVDDQKLGDGPSRRDIPSPSQKLKNATPSGNDWMQHLCAVRHQLTVRGAYSGHFRATIPANCQMKLGFTFDM